MDEAALARRILVIGQAPAEGCNDLPAFGGRCGRCLAALAGVLRFEDAFDGVNLLERWPSGEFPIMAAKRGAWRVANKIMEEGRQRVIFAGTDVALVMCWNLKYPMFTWGEITISLFNARLHVFQAAMIPYPSGIDPRWNDPVVRVLGTRFLRAAVKEEMV